MQTFKLHTRYFLLLFLSLLSLENYAQMMVSGTVVDDNQSPVEFASIFLKNTADDKVTSGGISDEKGQFSIKVNEVGNYNLDITFVGFVAWNKTLDIDASMDLGQIALATSANVLGEAVVTAERVIMEKRDDRLVFNVDKSPLKNGYDGLEVLQRSPNIVVDNNQNILIRNESARVMINGRLTNLSGTELSSFIEGLRSEDIKSIEVQTYMSANMDAENAGGVINIILAKKPIGFDGSVRNYYNTKREGDRTIHTGFNLNYGAAKWNIYTNYKFWEDTQVSPVFYTTDYYTTNDFLNDNWIWNERILRHNYSAGVVFDPNPKHSFGFDFFGRQNVFEYENNSEVMFSNSDTLVDNGVGGFKGRVHNDLKNFTVNYGWNIDTLGSKFRAFVDYYSQLDTEDIISSSDYEKGLLEDIEERTDYTLNTTIISSQADLEKSFKGGLNMELGAKISMVERANDLRAEFRTDDDWQPSAQTNAFIYNENILGGYVLFNAKVKEKNFFKFGLRVENTDIERIERLENSKIDQNYTGWFPSFYYSRDLPNNNNLAFSYSEQITRPLYNYLNSYSLRWNDFTYQVGNPDLGPEYLRKFDLTFRQKSQAVSVYYSRVTDVMKSTRTLDGLVTYFTILNRGLETQLGLDYNRYGNLTDWWFVNATGGVFRRKFVDAEFNETFTRNSGYFTMSNNFKINESTSVDLSGSYYSREVSGFCTEGPRYQIDLSLQKRFLDNRLIVRLDGVDIFNTQLFTIDCFFEGFNTTVHHKSKTQTLRLWVIYNFSGKNKSNNRVNEVKSEAGGRL